MPCRIITYGVEWENEAPEWALLFDTVRRKRLKRYLDRLADIEAIKQEKPPDNADKRTKIKYKLRLKEAQSMIPRDSDMEGLEPLPEPTPDQWIKAKEYLERPEPAWLGCAHRTARRMGAKRAWAIRSKNQTPPAIQASGTRVGFFVRPVEARYPRWESSR